MSSCPALKIDLSFWLRLRASNAMVAEDRESNLDRESVGVRLQRGLARELGDAMARGPATEAP